MTKHIWLPDSETKVTVSEGAVTVWDEMVMKLKPLAKPAGFAKEKEVKDAVDDPKKR